MRTEQEKREEYVNAGSGDRTWIFLLALLCVCTLGGLVTWGRIHMLEEDKASLLREIDRDRQSLDVLRHDVEVNMRKKKKLVMHLAAQVEHYAQEFDKLRHHMVTIQARAQMAVRAARERPTWALQECEGVVLPEGATLDRQVFPRDVAEDSSSLVALLSLKPYQPLYQAAGCAQSHGLFSATTSPWLLWTWLRVLDSFPFLKGSFSEWGVGSGGTSIFLAALARLRGDSFVGVGSVTDRGSKEAELLEHIALEAQACGLKVPQDARFTAGVPDGGPPGSNQLAFTHIAESSYDGTYQALSNTYGRSVDAGVVAIDNFFSLQPTPGPKKAVEDFFNNSRLGFPVIYPVFPGTSVIIFKSLFGDEQKGDVRNVMDGNFYSFDLIKGHPEIIAAVNRSVALISDVHREEQAREPANRTALCLSSLTLQSAINLRDFVMSPSPVTGGWEGAEPFRFLAQVAQWLTYGAAPKP